MVAVVMLITGCGGGSAEPTREEAPASPPVATATSIPIGMTGITWTTAVDPSTREPLDSVQQFPNDAPVIIAAVGIEDVPAGAVLTATWTIDGVAVPAATMTVTSGSTLATGWATFQLTREAGHLFPLGELSVTVSAEDGASVSGSVEIVVPGG